MSPSDRSKIVCELLNTDQLWAARLGHELHIAAEAHGGGVDEDFRDIVKVVGSLWLQTDVSKTTETIIKKDSAYILEKSRDEFYYLNVLAGGFAMYSIYVALTKKELQYWKEYGNYYLDKMATELCRDSVYASKRNLL